MSFESAVSFFIAIFIFGITPGPGIFAILARALTQGAGRCFFLGFGMTISDCLYLVAACVGLSTLATHWGEFFTVVRFVGAAYLFYLAYKMWKAPSKLEQLATEEGGAQKKAGHVMSLLQGMMISASNPKVILFYIAFLPSFMDLNALDMQDIALAVVLTIAALMLGLMLIAYFAARAGRMFQSERAVKRLNRGAGSLMAAAGAYLALRF